MHGILRHSPTVWRGLIKKGGIPFGDDLVFDWPNRVDGTLETYERISDGVDNGAFVGGEVLNYNHTPAQNIQIPDRTITDGYIEFTTHLNSLAATSNLLYKNSNNYSRIGTTTSITIRAITIKNYTVPDWIGVTRKVRIEFRKPASDLLIKVFIDGIESISGEQSYGDNTYTNGNIGPLVQLSIDGWISSFEQYDGVNTDTYYGNSLYNSQTGIEGTNNNSVASLLLNDEQLTSVQTALNNGFYHETATGKQVINPQYVLPVGWESFAGGADIFHNGINSYYSTNVLGNIAAKFDILDRINQTAVSTDSIYYDSTDRITRSLYYVGLEANELDITVLDSYMIQADKEKAYAQMKASYCDIQQMSEFFVYATQKTGTDALKVHKYINNTCQLVTTSGAQVYHLTLPVWIDLTP